MAETVRPPAAPPAAPPAPPLGSLRLRWLLAGGFLAVWGLTLLVDWFAHPGQTIVPAWWQALGCVILGYALGLDLVGLVNRTRAEQGRRA